MPKRLYDTWTLAERLELAKLLKAGLSPRRVADTLKEYDAKAKSYPSILAEIAKGLTPEQRERQQYVQYNVYRAYKEMLGDDLIEYICQQRNKENEADAKGEPRREAR